MKFEYLMQKAVDMDVDYIATGHYALTEYDEKSGRYLLKKSKADKKDQTYALYKLTQEQLSARVGKSRSHITNILGLLRLPSDVQELVTSNQLIMAHARVLSKLEDTEKILELDKRVINEHLSVRALEEIASNPDYKRKVVIKVNRPSREYDYVADAFTEKIGNKVKIQNKKIVIPFNSEKDLERILEILNVDVSVD